MSIINKIFNLLPLQIRIAVFKRVWMNKPLGCYGDIYSDSLNKAFEQFLTPEEQNDKQLVKLLTNDIIECWFKYKALPYEYFLFNFRNRNDEERAEFETDTDRIETLLRLFDTHLFNKEIRDKYNFYLIAKDYFKREVIKIDKDSSIEDFVFFCKRHRDVFIKPLAGSQGKGSHVFTYSDEKSAEGHLKQLLEEAPAWLLEERIRQSAAMGLWNETSVNTIRIPSFLRDNNFTVIWTRMRMGKKGAVVDNAGAGGIVVSVDPKTGVVNSDGIDEAHNHFEKHPGCGLTFKGWQVPRWDDLLKTVEELHRTVFSKHVYVAWDFALTDDGWVVIEGNWGQFLGQQTANQIGVRKQFHKLIGDYVQGK